MKVLSSFFFLLPTFFVLLSSFFFLLSSSYFLLPPTLFHRTQNHKTTAKQPQNNHKTTTKQPYLTLPYLTSGRDIIWQHSLGSHSSHKVGRSLFLVKGSANCQSSTLLDWDVFLGARVTSLDLVLFRGNPVAAHPLEGWVGGPLG